LDFPMSSEQANERSSNLVGILCRGQMHIQLCYRQDNLANEYENNHYHKN
jgi:hypothetical protein